MSGGEAQRIRLATQIGSGLVGVAYILDEPSIGLHQRDNDKLLGTLKHLRDLGNTVIVVEHDEDTMFAADHIVDIGPGAGEHGGEVIAEGTAEEIMQVPESITGAYLSGRIRIPIPEERRKPTGWLKIVGAQENNLKNIDVKIPLGVMTCVTGVSGSGKSSLVNEILYKYLAKKLNRARTIPGKHKKIEGVEQLDKVINIDQSPIGRTPRSNPATYTGVFDQIRDHDVLLHHPYETFDPVVDFVKQASKDPNVLAIKQTLYRVSSHSPIIASLAAAAENGKQVTVLVELKARFDEENNIIWARKLEQAGCHVIYGLVGLKTHSKITLVVRKEEDGIRRYVHLGTGNYNDSTAKLYTDMGLLTCRKAIGEDATAVFNMLSGYSEPAFWNKLAIAPIRLRDRFTQLINREKEFAKKGKKAFIRAKMNSLCDAGIISSLYEAAAAGVKIELVVRGICCLKTGMPGISENITVRSIVGDFLEHSRIFHFYNNGFEEVYMGSADWMPRNLDKRVEILFPVEDDALKAEVIHILDIQLADNEKARILQKNGTYRRAAKGGHAKLNSQKYFCEEAKRAQKERKKQNKNTHTFEPLHSVPEE